MNSVIVISHFSSDDHSERKTAFNRLAKVMVGKILKSKSDQKSIKLLKTK